jgi:molybdopterin synthase sulfur carrier subunit
LNDLNAIRLFYFARLREDLGISEEEIQLPEHVGTVDQLRRHLMTRGDAWQNMLAPSKSLRVALNHEMVKGDAPVRAGDEVALFPPVTGG